MLRSLSSGFLLNIKAFFLTLLLCPALSFSQKTTKIDLVNANTLEYNKQLGENVKRLIGSVVLKHDSTYLYCDSAYLNSESNNVDAYGHVRINSGTVIINGEVLNYDGDSRNAVMHRNVSMTDNKMTLTTDLLTYNTRTDIGNYTTGGKIVDPDNVLTSNIGYYYAGKKQFFFKKNVVLVNPKYTMRSDTLMYNTETEVSYFYGPTTIVSKENFIYCENGWYNSQNDIAQFNKNAYFKNKEQKLSGDSLYYDRKIGYGKALNNITALDTVQKITIQGDYGEYWEKPGITLVTKKAVLIQAIEKDSLFLHADTLKAFTDSTGAGKRLFAFHHAKFFKTDMQGVADSIYYSFKDSVIYMYKRPMLWTDKNQLSGDTINIHLSHGEIKQLNIYSSSFIISRDDSIRYNQIKGKNLVGHFIENKLHRIDVFGNGETIYYVRDDKTKLIGVNKAEADNLLIFVKENAIKTITFLTKPEAVLYPEKDLSINDVRLKNFKWEEENRPCDRYDIFN
ncbi:MAG: OstA-like protein [Bacteroidales bacterium]